MRRVSVALGFLVLAWLCALQPQSLIVGMISWLRSSTHFSHQRELMQSVRVTLAQAKQPGHRTRAYASSREDSSPKTVPTMPAPSVPLEKVQLAIVGALNVLPPVGARWAAPNATFRPETRSRDVPVPVPRSMG